MAQYTQVLTYEHNELSMPVWLDILNTYLVDTTTPALWFPKTHKLRLFPNFKSSFEVSRTLIEYIVIACLLDHGIHNKYISSNDLMELRNMLRVKEKTKEKIYWKDFVRYINVGTALCIISLILAENTSSIFLNEAHIFGLEKLNKRIRHILFVLGAAIHKKHDGVVPLHRLIAPAVYNPITNENIQGIFKWRKMADIQVRKVVHLTPLIRRVKCKKYIKLKDIHKNGVRSEDNGQQQAIFTTGKMQRTRFSNTNTGLCSGRPIGQFLFPISED